MDAPALAIVSHDRVVAAVAAIAAAIEADGFAPEIVVGIGRGGLVPATFLSHRLGLALVSIDLSSDLPGFGAALFPALSQCGRRLLVVDDINDSGGTIATLRRALAGVELRVAVLVDNVRSGARTNYRGEAIDRAEDRRWFVFPWEAVAPAAAIAADAARATERRY